MFKISHTTEVVYQKPNDTLCEGPSRFRLSSRRSSVAGPSRVYNAICWRRETGLSPPVKHFNDCSKPLLLLWIFYVLYVLFLLCLFARLFICALWSPAGKGLTS